PLSSTAEQRTHNPPETFTTQLHLLVRVSRMSDFAVAATKLYPPIYAGTRYIIRYIVLMVCVHVRPCCTMACSVVCCQGCCQRPRKSKARPPSSSAIFLGRKRSNAGGD